jgi:peroxiredoxin
MKAQKLYLYAFSKKIGLYIVVLLLGLGVFHGSPVFAEEDFFAAPNAARLEERLKAPAFVLPSINGEEIRLEDYHGNVVVLNFWATWCSFCTIERPKLQKIYDKYKDKGLVVLGVSIDRAEHDIVRKFVEDQKITYPILHDQTLKVAQQYGVRGTPTTYLLDVEGNTIGRIVGPAEWDSQEAYDLIEQLIAEKN